MASAWSVRPTPDARVSMPLTLGRGADCDPAAFTLTTVPERFAESAIPHAGIDEAKGLAGEPARALLRGRRRKARATRPGRPTTRSSRASLRAPRLTPPQELTTAGPSAWSGSRGRLRRGGARIARGAISPARRSSPPPRSRAPESMRTRPIVHFSTSPGTSCPRPRWPFTGRNCFLSRRDAELRGGTGQGGGEDFVHPLDQHDLQLVPDLLRDLPADPPRRPLERSPASCPQPVRRQHLLLDAAHRQHAAAQGDLAGHRRCRCAPRRPVSSDTSAVNMRHARATGRPWASRPRARGCACRSCSKHVSDRCRARRRARARSRAPPAPTPSSRRRAAR